MALVDRIQKDMVEAMKAKQELRLGTIRMVKAALMKFKVDNIGKDLDEAAEMQILNMLIKQRRESADVFRKNDRAELADKEEAELAILEGYMPAGATEAEVDEAISAALADIPGATAKQMGLVMKAAQAKLAGKRVDGKALSEAVKARLA
jgi:uncharacterized protein